jgi:L-ornithine N5-oxygenase
MKWCARKVEKEMSKTMAGSVFGYGERVIRVEAVLDISSEVAGVKLLKVVSRSSNDGTERIRFARNLIISTGGSAKIPASLQFTEGSVTGSKGLGRVIHTSRFLESIEPALKEITLVSRITALDRPLRIAVIGAGQSASEVFLAVRASLANHLPSTMDHRPEIDLYIRRSTLRPADASEFSNEVFDPGMSQAVHGLEEEGREMLMKEVRGTNYSVVNPRTVAEVRSALPIPSSVVLYVILTGLINRSIQRCTLKKSKKTSPLQTILQLLLRRST